jgi:hypothetical protein
MRYWYLFFILFIVNIPLFGQLASWSLTADGTPTNVASNVTAGIFKKGTGLNTLSYTSSGGASCSGWTTSATPDTSDYYQIYIAPINGYKLTINTLAFKEYRSSTGIRAYEIRISNTPDFSTYTTLATDSVPDDILTRDGTLPGLNIIVNNGDTLYIRWYGYKAEGSTGTWHITANTLALSGTVSQINTHDNDSYASEPNMQVSGDTISSVRTSLAMAKHIFSFKLKDAGTADGLPTHVSFIAIKNANSTNWQNVIGGAFIKINGNNVAASDTTISQYSISFSFNQGILDIPNGDSVTIDLYIYLKPSPLTDNTIIKCNVDSSSFDSYITGSGFSTSSSPVVSNQFNIDVIGTKLNIISQPPLVFPNAAFPFICEITDNNGNRDLNYSGNIQIQRSLGTGHLQSASGLSIAATNGLAQWNDLTYDSTGIFQMTVSDVAGLFTSVYSNYIYCINAPTLLDEHFSDGNFTQNPTWIGNTGDFIVNSSYQLELSTVASGSSYLSTPVKLVNDSIEWQTWLYLNFDPSSSNNIKYYLAADNSDFTKPLKGYYLQIGVSAPEDDAIKFYYQDSLTSTLLATATVGAVDTTPQVRVKVIRTHTGLWRIYADYVGGSAFVLETTANETSFLDTIIFTGVVCNYTSSNATGKFFFDDFYTGPVQIDSIKPTLSEIRVLDSLHLDLIFSEGISLSTAQDTSNYVVNNSIGIPGSAVRDNLNAALIHLTFNTPFTSGLLYIITLDSLTDFSNNMISQPIAENFMWYYVQPFDVEINEIMADPSPVVQLPNYEYLELYNRSNYTIDLLNWTLTIGNSTVPFPSYKLTAGSYVILCHSSAVTALSPYGTTIPIISSTSALTNSGTSITLNSNDGRTIHYVNYSDSWYQSSLKKSGGWSLEQIDPMNPCGEDANWIASTNVKGGTPGAKNSVFKSNPDLTIPDLLRAALLEPDTLILTFNETIMDNILTQPSTISVNHGIGNPSSITFINQDHKKLLLIFSSSSFIKDTIYTVSVATGVKNCAGNTTTVVLTASFAIGDSTYPNCLIINEVLPYPQTGGSDYIEIYNPTQLTFNLKDLNLANVDNTNQIHDLYEINPEGFYVFPGDYVVLTSSAKGVTSNYYTPFPKKIAETTSFPSLGSTSGRVTLVNKNFEFIDDFSYTDSMQFQLLNSFKGVALERIHPDLPTQDAKNWHSAAESCGFGTPTYKNSQYAQFAGLEGSITVEPEVFSPDMDGKDDILNIRYKFTEPGYVANVTIFDAKGRLIRQLARNEMCGIEGYFTWDGMTESKTKAEIGIYVVYVEVFSLNGTTKAYKKPCVLAGYLR